MGYKRVETLGDVVRFGLTLTVTCLGCGRVRQLPATQLYRRFRASTRLKAIGARLKCMGIDLDTAGCGHVGAHVDFIIPEPPAPDDDPPGGGNVVQLLPRLAGSQPFYDHARTSRRVRR